MILPDINLLVYAYNSDAPRHSAARRWWEDCLSDSRTVALPWVVLLGYLRLMTSRQVLREPFEAEEAMGHIRSWLERPNTQILLPGARHLDLMQELMREVGATSRLTTDIHLAAMALAHQAELHSSDTDFMRFPGLRWTDPLQASGR